MNKTLYIRDEDAPIWERARELAGEKLSPVIVSALKQFVTQKEAESTGLDRIEFEFLDASKLLRRNALYGRWLIAPDENYRPRGVSVMAGYAVAVGGKGGIVLHNWSGTKGGIRIGSVTTFPSLEAALRDTERGGGEVREVFKEVVKRTHIPTVEELDV